MAIADALNAGVPEVVWPVVQALLHINVPMTKPRAVVMGLEKVTDPAALADAVVTALGDRRLRVGRVGGQPHAGRSVSALLGAGTAIRAERGSLACADLLVYDEEGNFAVTASVKINASGFRIPQDPQRLWTTTGRRDALQAKLPPHCAVAEVGGEVLKAYMHAYRSVVSALHAGDLHRPMGSGVVAEVLRRRWASSVASAYTELLERADAEDADTVPAGLLETTLEVPTLEVPGEFSEYQESDHNNLTVLTRRPLTDAVLPHAQFYRAA